MTQSTVAKKLPIEPLILRPTRGWSSLNLPDLWRYRELVFFLTWRDIKVRYKQTALGAAWAIIQPLFTMVIFTIFFGRMAGIKADNNVPYPIFSYTALLPWTLFAKAMSDAGRALISNRSMITKVYFPRLVIPVSTVFSGLVDFAIAFLVLIAMMVYYGSKPQDGYQLIITSAVWTLPLFLLLAMVTALGVGLWFAALSVIYRDVNYVIPFITQFWLFVTPIAYPASKIPEKWRLLYYLNPMAGVVEGFRWSLLNSGSGPGPTLAVSTTIAIVVLITGLFYFRRMERTFADEL
ncbi:MAG: ABC transporter permease [Omnitrophica WOR_2 bacterium]